MAKHTENKTKPSDTPVETFLASIKNTTRQTDARILCELFHKVTGHDPVLWGPSIIGYGTYHYIYASGREGDMSAAGFSPRAVNITIYLVDGISRYTDKLNGLGPHTTGKACLYIKRLSDIDIATLEDIITLSYQYVVERKDAMPRAE